MSCLGHVDTSRTLRCFSRDSRSTHLGQTSEPHRGQGSPPGGDSMGQSIRQEVLGGRREVEPTPVSLAVLGAGGMCSMFM